MESFITTLVAKAANSQWRRESAADKGSFGNHAGRNGVKFCTSSPSLDADARWTWPSDNCRDNGDCISRDGECAEIFSLSCEGTF